MKLNNGYIRSKVTKMILQSVYKISIQFHSSMCASSLVPVCCVFSLSTTLYNTASMYMYNAGYCSILHQYMYMQDIAVYCINVYTCRILQYIASIYIHAGYCSILHQCMYVESKKENQMPRV